MTWVKICGITNLDDALSAADAGADMLGFIFNRQSRRYVEPDVVGQIVHEVHTAFGPRAPFCIGVFVGSELSAVEMSTTCLLSGVDAAQVVGLTDPRPLHRLWIPAYACIRPQTETEALQEMQRFELDDLPARLPTLQLDAYHPDLPGGSGLTPAEEVVRVLIQNAERLLLSGGLTPDNVSDFVSTFAPWGVDTASGTETTPGTKDPLKVRDFIQAAKSS